MSTFLQLMNSQIPLEQMAFFSVRIIVAGICGAIVGFERSRRFKEAGIRTHVVVACTAALLMIVSKYGFADLITASGETFAGTRGADSARIAAQVVSGVSFLGAGVIFKNGSSIKGLTTAAGVWATAAIGLSIGSGMYYLGLFTTFAILIVQIIMHKFTIGNDFFVTNDIVIIAYNSSDFQHILKNQLKTWSAQTLQSNIIRESDTTRYELLIKFPKSIDFDEVLDFIEKNKTVKAFEYHSES